MNYTKPLKLLKNLPNKLNNFFNKNYKPSLKISNKSKNKKVFDPVTNLDKAFEKFIRNIIIKKFPKDAILGEEFLEKHSDNEYKWFIDPIDGTRAFVVGAPTWSNLIGLTHNNRSIIGLANFPALNKFYINNQKKSYLINNKKTILKTSKETKLKKCKVVGHLHEWIFLKKYNKKVKKIISSVSYFGVATFDALNFCLLAEGKVDAVIETNLKPFDIVPLISIIEKAGGVVTTWNNKSAIQGGNILASSNKKIHNKIIKILKSSD
jgi:histidinol phosphatase-like enzyme (inositol monophosphatase family)|tara:strand:+ start:1265 stop:2059 length:795 start_codon:yes stop_codon:yes gene_type:complete